MAKKKSGKFDRDGIDDLAQNKPVVYKLLNAKGVNVYTGSSKKGQVGERLEDHLPGGQDPIPGVKRVQIEQHDSIKDARDSESRIIRRSKPKHNKKGK